MKRFGIQVSLFLVVGLLLATHRVPCHAAELEKSLTSMLQQAINHHRIKSPNGPVIVGAFIGNAQQDLSSGAGIRLRIIDKLKAMDVKVVRRGEFPILSGEYSYVSESQPMIDLTLRVQDVDKQEVASFPERIDFLDNAETIIDVTAPTLILPAGQSLSKQVQNAIAQPQVEVGGGKAAAVNGACGVKVLVNGSPCELEDDGGVAVASISRGSRYELLLTNGLPHATIASVSIDGLDVFAFAGLPAKPPGFIVNAGQSFLLKGWFITPQRADSFVVGDFAESAAAQELGSGADAGVIVVKFRAGWPKGDTPPPGEHPRDLPRGADGTLRGEPVEQRLKSVPFEIGSLREIVSIRYGS